MMAPKHWLKHVNLDIMSANSVRRGMKMRTIPRSITPSVQRMWVFPAPVCWISTRWFGRMGCSNQKTVSSCAGNISRMPQTDTNTATMQAFKQSLLHPDIAMAAAVSAAVLSSKDKSGMKGRGSMLLQSKGESWVTSWGTISGKRGGGFGSAMVVLVIFLWLQILFASEYRREERKNKVGSKKSNASWSITRPRVSNRYKPHW